MSSIEPKLYFYNSIYSRKPQELSGKLYKQKNETHNIKLILYNIIM